MLLSVLTVDDALLTLLSGLVVATPHWMLQHHTQQEAVWVALAMQLPDVLVSDLDIGDGAGRERGDRWDGLGKRPLLVLVGSQPASTMTVADHVLRLGAFDYILKPVDLDRVAFALAVAAGPEGP